MNVANQIIGKKFPIWFNLYDFENKGHVVEKADEQGRVRRYLKGIASGIKYDATNERMTQACIDDMLAQSRSGEVLMYEGQHGVNYTEDLGRLVEAELTSTGEWIITCRLYDVYDGFDPKSYTLERADKLWRQVNGLAPYENPMKKGFSIEGRIPEGGILSMDNLGGSRIIDKVLLRGVLVTPDPCYEDSNIIAIYKALDIDEIPAQSRDRLAGKMRNNFQAKLEKEESQSSFYMKKCKADEVLDESIEYILKMGTQIADRLNILFDEYKQTMVGLILSHQSAFEREEAGQNPDVLKAKRLQVFKDIEDRLNGLMLVIKTRTQSKETQYASTKRRGTRSV
jgi:hypothetical protein